VSEKPGLLSRLLGAPLQWFFDRLEKILSGIRTGCSRVWRSFADGPLQNILFVLILGFTGLVLLLELAFSELDRLLSGIEKTIICFAMLAMVALCFLAYLQRSMPEVTISMQGGPNMATVLMVWVGFLGASLATQQNKHLSVDATSRILTPPSARFAKRFISLVAAGFCWKMAAYSGTMVEHSLDSQRGVEGLFVADWMVPTLNGISNALGQTEPGSWLKLGVLVLVLFAGIGISRRWRNRTESKGHAAIRFSADAVAALASILLVLSVLAPKWSPVNEAGENVEWLQYQLTTEKVAAISQADLDELAGLLEEDTGIDEAAAGATPADTSTKVAELVAGTKGDQRFPLWLAQAVLPLSFFLMALRFLGVVIKGRAGPPVGPSEVVPTAPKAGGRNTKDTVWAGLFPGILVGLGATLLFGKGGLIFATGILLILMGAPLFLAIGMSALSCVVLIQGFSPDHIAKDMFEAVKKPELLAIPFFVLAGNIMTQGTIALRLVNVAKAAMGRTPGGLGLSTIFACVIFAAISGSSPVTVIAVGGIMFPMLVRDRYPENYSLGVLTSAGSLGIIIPPSVPMIVYAIMVSTKDAPVSPNDLFIAGVLPGLFIAALLVFYTLYKTRPSSDVDIKLPVIEGSYSQNLLKELIPSIPSLMLPVLILGGIYGILGPIKFDVTEAAAVAVVYALFVELVIHREMKLRALPKIISDSGVMMGGLFLIIVLALAFNKFLAEQMIPQDAAQWLSAHVDNKWQFLILCNLFLLALGCIMDILSAILIVAPLLAPIAYQFGIDPVHFGIIFIVNLELGYLTPPMGINLFVASAVFDRPLVQVMKSVLPFLLLMLFALAVISWFPQLSLAFLDGGTELVEAAAAGVAP
jgi:C4-dicarboxylate transporter DctM subunit